MARPTKLTPDTHDKIRRLVAAGNYLETAAAAAGIDRRTLRRWMTAGARGEEPYAAFAADIDIAIAEAEARGVLALQKAAQGGDWRAQLEVMKRRFRDRWGDGIDVRVMDNAADQLLEIIRLRQEPDEGTYDRVLELLSQEDSDREETGKGGSVH